jgi:hypothetical protein
MKQRKFYYIIEEIDINGDKQSDGFLISQYKIDKQNNKIFTKNKYVTYEKFKSVMQKYNKGGFAKPILPNNNNEVVFITKEQFNEYMNNKDFNKVQSRRHYNSYNSYDDDYHYHGRHYNNGYHHNRHYPPQSYQSHPPHVAVQGSGGFMSNFVAGAGIGAGASVADHAIDGLFSFFGA